MFKIGDRVSFNFQLPLRSDIDCKVVAEGTIKYVEPLANSVPAWVEVRIDNYTLTGTKEQIKNDTPKVRNIIHTFDVYRLFTRSENLNLMLT